MLKKLSSRKFIVTFISALVGILAIFVGNNEVVTAISSMLMVVVPSVVYCITEGKIDAESVKASKKAIDQAAAELLNKNSANAVKSVTDIAETLLTD